jgi:D-proline reductase (dithiol) PrdB
MEILEKREEWLAEFEVGWLAHYNETGETDWKLYPRPNNQSAPGTAGIDLSASRLMLISTAGAYLPDSQAPFEEPDRLGNYSIRTFPAAIPLETLAYSHTHYDHAAVEADQQVLLPLRHLDDMVAEGVIGDIAPSVISVMGYMPVLPRLIDETIPEIVDIAKEEDVRAALLVPA